MGSWLVTFFFNNKVETRKIVINVTKNMRAFNKNKCLVTSS